MSHAPFARKLLAPLTPAYRLALWLREMRLRSGLESTRRLRFPVVSIGNLSTGGTGKTPLTIALAKALKQRGFHVDVLSRGYGRKGHAPRRVDPEGTAEQFGDEPLLIARAAGVPVYVSRQRYEAGLLVEADRAAMQAAGEAAKPAIHLLDDGFQHRQLARDVDIVLVNRQDWQDSLLPSGNLREPLSAARRAGILAIPAEDLELETELRSWGWKGTIWRIHRQMEIPKIEGAVLAFCGIARPNQFFAGLEAAGVRLGGRRAFPDHHKYSSNDVQSLVADARAKGAAALLTTEKDLVRLGELASRIATSMLLKSIELRVDIDHEDGAIAELITRLGLSA